MNKSLLFYFLVSLLLFTSCEKKEAADVIDLPKVEILGEGSPLNLETLDFTENTLRLYTKISKIDSLEALFEVYKRRDPFIIEDLRFKAQEIESLGLSIPDFSYGYVFEGEEKDSIAHLHNMYFSDINTLTNMDKKIVAVTTSSSYREKANRDSKLDSLKSIYGNPLLEVAVSSEFNQNSYSWVTKDKIIEVKTSRGFTIEATTSGNSENYDTYQLDLLLIDIEELELLVEAHRSYYDGNYERTYTPKLIKSEFLPELVNLKTYFMDNCCQRI